MRGGGNTQNGRAYSPQEGADQYKINNHDAEEKNDYIWFILAYRLTFFSDDMTTSIGSIDG